MRAIVKSFGSTGDDTRGGRALPVDEDGAGGVAHPTAVEKEVPCALRAPGDQCTCSQRCSLEGMERTETCGRTPPAMNFSQIWKQ